MAILVKTVPGCIIKAFMIFQLIYQCFTGQNGIKLTLADSLCFSSSGRQPAWWLVFNKPVS